MDPQTRPAWYWMESGLGPAAFNMALDEALLENCARLQRPVLRFYGWTEPAASFGYFQKYGEVERLTSLRPLVRRPTGGGIVPHDADWTYSLVFPHGHEWHQLAAIESYRRVHEWLAGAFALAGLRTLLAPASQKAEPGRCFAGYELFDVLWRGQKLAGAAQRRKREGLLIQGSVQPAAIGVQRAVWEEAMREVAREARWQNWEPDQALNDRARELMQKKYSQTSYNQNR